MTTNAFTVIDYKNHFLNSSLLQKDIKNLTFNEGIVEKFCSQ